MFLLCLSVFWSERQFFKGKEMKLNCNCFWQCFFKEPNDIKKEPEPTNENVPIKESVDEKEEKKSNGAHTPV